MNAPIVVICWQLQLKYWLLPTPSLGDVSCNNTSRDGNGEERILKKQQSFKHHSANRPAQFNSKLSVASDCIKWQIQVQETSINYPYIIPNKTRRVIERKKTLVSAYSLIFSYITTEICTFSSIFIVNIQTSFWINNSVLIVRNCFTYFWNKYYENRWRRLEY